MLNNIRYDPNAELFIIDIINWFCDSSEKILNKIIYKYEISQINKDSADKHIIFYKEDDFIVSDIL
jgi:hypothetical protein